MGFVKSMVGAVVSYLGVHPIYLEFPQSFKTLLKVKVFEEMQRCTLGKLQSAHFWTIILSGRGVNGSRGGLEFAML